MIEERTGNECAITLTPVNMCIILLWENEFFIKKKTSFIEHNLSNFNIEQLTKYYLVNYIYLYMYVYLLFLFKMVLNTITLILFIIIVVDLYKFLLLFNQVIILIKNQRRNTLLLCLCPLWKLLTSINILRQVGGILQSLRFPPPIKLTAMT